MKSLKTFIIEKILINKNTKFNNEVFSYLKAIKEVCNPNDDYPDALGDIYEIKEIVLSADSINTFLNLYAGKHTVEKIANILNKSYKEVREFIAKNDKELTNLFLNKK